MNTVTLTDRSLFRLEYVPPPPSCSHLVLRFFHFRCEEEEIWDIQPAAAGQLLLLPSGEGEMHFAEGRVARCPQTALIPPLTRAAPFHVRGPFHAIGASFTPLGWASFTRIHAGEHRDQIYRAADWLGEEVERLGARVCDAYRAGRMSGEQAAGELCNFIESRLQLPDQRHVALIEKVTRWLASSLNPEIDRLMQAVDYSPRQVQRLVERYFGLPPKPLARKYRAARAAMLLSLPELTDEHEAMVRSAFFDQSHMIREIRLFAGRTPARIQARESAYADELLNPANFQQSVIDGFEGQESA